MESRTTLLKIISDGKFHSGPSLSVTLQISRAAVWKNIQALKLYGMDIYAVKGKGYRLAHPIELLDPKVLGSLFPDKLKKHVRVLEVFQEIDSTNQYLMRKRVRENIHGHIVLAEYQTLGKGRRGNQWLSPLASGICLSMGWQYDPQPEGLNLISLFSGLAVARALKVLNYETIKLKWPNDIYLRGRKLGGILIETTAESAGPCDVVIGIGLNIHLPDNFPGDMSQPVIDLSAEGKELPPRNRIAAEIIKQVIIMLESIQKDSYKDLLNEWRIYDCMRGKRAKIIFPDKSYQGFVNGVNDRGLLSMTVKGKKKLFSSGQLNLRSMV